MKIVTCPKGGRVPEGYCRQSCLNYPGQGKRPSGGRCSASSAFLWATVAHGSRSIRKILPQEEKTILRRFSGSVALMAAL